jgi:hypothetical protein
MDAIQALKSAIEKNKVEVHIPIDIGGEVVEFMLDELDAYEIQEQQEIKRQQALARAAENGLTGAPLSESEWMDYVNGHEGDTRERVLAEGKPRDRAEFFARKTAGVRVLLDVITGTLKVATGEKAFKTADDERLFKRWLSTDAAAMKALSDAYVELSKKVKETRDSAKKSSSRANGESVTPPPDDTQDIEAHSVSN